MNPDLMRSEYPKFIYMLQDIMRDQVWPAIIWTRPGNNLIETNG